MTRLPALACLALCLPMGLGLLHRPASASDFTRFADDENACRAAGTAAIAGATGPDAARRYDLAHGRCMVSHGRRRQIDAMQQAAPPARRPRAAEGDGPGSPGFPDAYYSVPYATPGYGYDGFSY